MDPINYDLLGDESAYDILGVSRDAPLEAIRIAYRQAAVRNHPDRGGSELRMRQTNLAFEILSDPEHRAYYDRVYAQRKNVAVVEQWVNGTDDLRQRASQYPKKWAEFEKWMEGFMADVKAARYGKSQIWGTYYMPIADGSISAKVFIGIGTVLIGGAILILGVGTGVYQSLFDSIRHPIPRLALLAGPFLLGAWAGQRFHMALRQALMSNQASDGSHLPGISEKPQTSSSPGITQSPGPQSLPAPEIVQCSVCGRKLRVPQLGKELLITCPFCTNKFSYRP